MKLANYELHKVVEYIRHYPGGFVFDSFDVAENMDDILNHYGFSFILDQEDRQRLASELLPLAYDYQTQEVERLMMVEGY